MQPFQYDLRSSAAKDDSIAHAAAAPTNLDAATTMRVAASRGKPAPIYVATSNDDNEAAIPMQSATRDSRNA